MKRARGFSLVGAIFLIVVIALLAGFMVTIGALSRATPAAGAMGARAHYAAVSGIEWGAHQALAVAGAPVCFASPASFAAEFGFTLDVTCAATPVTEGTQTYVVFDIVATARRGSPTGGDYFSRTLSASVASAP